MTLTAHSRGRSARRPAGSVVDASTAGGSASTLATTPTRSALVAVLVRDDVFRIHDGEFTVGFVQVAGPVFVALAGTVYNTSCEVAQCLDLESAMARLDAIRA